MSASSQAVFDMKPFHFIRSGAFNSDTGKDIAKLYIETGRLRTGVRILGLEEHVVRLKSLVSVLQPKWGSANKIINRDRGKPNEESGERSANSSPSDFVFGKGVSDNVSGDGMVRAVMNMAIFVVECLEKDSPKAVPDDKTKRTHTAIVVAMFVGAIYALQHDKASAFTTALFGDSLAKVVVYSNINNINNVEKRIEESEAMRFEENKTHRETSFALEKAAEKNKSLQHELGQERRLVSRYQDIQTEIKKDLKESQNRCNQVEQEREGENTKRTKAEQKLGDEKTKRTEAERNLNDEKTKRARVEAYFEEVQCDLAGALSKVTQLEHDLDEEKKEKKSKPAQLEHDPNHQDKKPEGEPPNVVQQLMADLEEFVNTLTGIGLEIKALYGIQPPTTEAEEQ